MVSSPRLDIRTPGRPDRRKTFPWAPKRTNEGQTHRFPFFLFFKTRAQCLDVQQSVKLKKSLMRDDKI
ncbi:hypothetical protein CEXT_490881 [Caerostris extrusa]|uniref:Uncharacterized protein n=1 Tax=Caerostris extrusa TaxID=172846 RepID=A0AAV4XLZ2_CAEEX|nr:hypothetical protein CEXT_490881 [Caerostris extrusa]